MNKYYQKDIDVTRAIEKGPGQGDDLCGNIQKAYATQKTVQTMSYMNGFCYLYIFKKFFRVAYLHSAVRSLLLVLEACCSHQMASVVANCWQHSQFWHTGLMNIKQGLVIVFKVHSTSKKFYHLQSLQ